MFEISNIKYFIPRVIKIDDGDTVYWINRDSVSHHLVSGNVDEGKPDGIFNTMEILSQSSFSKKIENADGIIHYYCVIHPSERGSIIVNPKKSNNILRNPDSVSLDTNENLNLLEDMEAKPESKLSRYVDPIILETLRKPHSDILKNKVLTIVFWDITGFSRLCEKLDNQPHLIIGILQEFFNQADIIIHKYGGILDKFVGDSILGIFGYKDEIYEDRENIGSLKNAANCAIEMDKSFESIKNEWINIWHSQFSIDVDEVNLKCAIHRGNALVGKIITQQRDQFTVLGTTVNFTNRLVDRAENKRIVVSKEVAKKLENRFKFKKIMISPPDKIKSFENVEEYYQLLY